MRASALLLTLRGKHPRAERAHDEWPGYANSRPVPVGNGAANQHQLDTYGWVLDAASLVTKAGEHLSSETWRAMAGFADRVARQWPEPDAGIWEIRGDAQHHVHSKLMAWLAIDRALRIGETHRLSHHRRRWQTARDEIAQDVRTHGFDEARSSYTRSYGFENSTPLFSCFRCSASKRPTGRAYAARSTRSNVNSTRAVPCSTATRPDAMASPAPQKRSCRAFWMVQALATAGRTTEATDRLAALLELASPLGLYAEEMDPISCEHLGNFPQALTHAALVQAALALRANQR